MAPWLPERNSGDYQAIIDYLKYLLGRTAAGTPYPPSPNPTELDQVPQISPECILADLTVFSLNPPVTDPSCDDKISLPRQKPCWVTSKALFNCDLARYRVPRMTLVWGKSDDSVWNCVVLAICLKHWLWAKEHNAFSHYSIDPKFSGNAIVLGVMERWVRGQRPAGNPNSAKKNNKRRMAVSQSHKFPMFDSLI